jgi:hypothetical protein
MYQRINKFKDTTFIYSDVVDETPYDTVKSLLNVKYYSFDNFHFKSQPNIFFVKGWRLGCKRGWLNCCDHIIDGRLTIQEYLQKVSGYKYHYSTCDTNILHAIAFSIILGCKNIYLYGIDLNYKIGYVNGHLTGPDGASHHGMWDLAMLQIVPGIRIASPRDGKRLVEELNEAIEVSDAPTVIRFPKGSVSSEIEAVRRLADGVDVLMESPAKDVLILTVGSMANMGLQVAKMLADQGIGATVIDPRWVIPVPESVVSLASKHRLVVTIEDGIRVGGIGTRVRQDLRAAQVDTALSEIGLPDEFLEHASRDEILDRVGLNAQDISREIVAQVLGARVPHARAIPEDSVVSDQARLAE